MLDLDALDAMSAGSLPAYEQLRQLAADLASDKPTETRAAAYDRQARIGKPVLLGRTAEAGVGVQPRQV